MEVKKSLYLKIVLSSVLIVEIGITVLLFYTYMTNVNLLKRHAIDGNMKDLNLISEKIDAYLDMLELVSAFTYEKDLQSFIVPTDEETAITRMRRLRNFQEFYTKRLVSLNFEGQIRDIYFIYPDGAVLHKGESIFDSEYDFTEQSWYKTAVNTAGKAVIVDTHYQDYNLAPRYPELSFQMEKQCISLARRVNIYGQNTLLGVLMMDIEVNRISDIVGPLLLGDQSSVYFSNEEGIVLYSGDYSEIGTDILAQLTENFKGQAEGSISGEVNGIDCVTTWIQSPKTGWYLININPTELIISDIVVMKKNITAMAILIFGLTILLSAAYATQIFKPVKKLTDAMRKAENGNLDISVCVSSKDEIGYLALSFNHMLQKIRELIKDNYLRQLKEKDAQIESLQLQINPHFLYNTLESVNCIAMIYEVEEICTISRSLANMFRYSIKNAGNVVSVKDEINHIRNYINILKIRFDKKINVAYDVDEFVGECKMLPLVLQPLVENSVKYSVEEQGRTIHILISVIQQENVLRICVEDDGVGIESQKLEQLRLSLDKQGQNQYTDRNHHIGIFNVHSRLRLHYGENYGLHIESSQGNFTRVYFYVPCEESTHDFRKGPH